MLASTIWIARTLLASTALHATLIFVACAMTLPRVLATLEARDFAPDERASMQVAVERGDGFALSGLVLPATLKEAPFLGERAQPAAPTSTEPLERARVVSRDAAGVLMETVWSNDDYVMTSRYRVQGLRVTPVWQKVLGLSQAFQTFLLAVVATLAYLVWPARVRRAMRRRAAAAAA